MAHAFNQSTLLIRAFGSQRQVDLVAGLVYRVPEQPGLHRETLTLKRGRMVNSLAL